MCWKRGIEFSESFAFQDKIGSSDRLPDAAHAWAHGHQSSPEATADGPQECWIDMIFTTQNVHISTPQVQTRGLGEKEYRFQLVFSEWALVIFPPRPAQQVGQG